MSDTKVGGAPALTPEEQYKKCLDDLLRRGVLVTGHPHVEGLFVHSIPAIETILKLESQIFQAEAEKEYRLQEWAQVLTNISADVIKGEAELKTAKEKLAGYEEAAPEVRALHTECQQVKARLHAFEQRYDGVGESSGDVIAAYNRGIGTHREIEARVSGLSKQLSAQMAELNKVTEEKDEALRETLQLRALLDGSTRLLIKLKQDRKPNK